MSRSRPTAICLLTCHLMLGALAVLPGAEVSAQTALRVNGNAPPGGDGSTWPTAIDDLALALTEAATIPGLIEIWVAANTYLPDAGTGDVDRSFDLPAEVHLLGGFAGNETTADQRDPAAHETILSGDLLGNDLPGWQQRADNSRQVIRARDLDLPSLIDGFTITGGNADFEGSDFLGGGAIFAERAELDVHRCLFMENTAGTTAPTLGNFGGAIFVKDSGTLTVNDCRFERNRANSGGAIGTMELGGPLDVFVSNSIFDGNDAPTQSAGALRFGGRALIIEDSEFTDNHAGYGGAMATHLAERLEIRDCTFAGNIADVKNAALWIDRSDNGHVTPAVIERCEFLDNWTDGGTHGGVASLEETVTHMTDCTFRGNFNVRVNPITGAIEGATTVNVTFEEGHEFRNCLFEDNFAGVIGGLQLFRAEAVITSCSFVNNRAASASQLFASGIDADRSSVAIDNTIIWNNRVGVGPDGGLAGTGGESAQISLSSSLLTINHSLVEGWTGSFGGTGNIGDDPLFVDEGGGNLRLTGESPAVDTGNNAAVPADLLHDLDGSPRIVDGDGDLFAVVDMGAYEFQGGVAGVETSLDGELQALELFPARAGGGRVQLRYRLSSDARVSLAIFDVHGRLIRKLVDTRQTRGEHRISWDETDGRGSRASSGVYFVRLTTDVATRTSRLVLIR